MNFSMTSETIIRELNMTPLNLEGGFCTELYKCAIHAENGRACGSSIYYLLRGNDRSRWHKLKSDEIWHYHAGIPALQMLIYPDRHIEFHRIGVSLTNGERPQSIIPANTWQTAILLRRTKTDWGLFGATVFPGFEYEDFTGAEDQEILELFPEHRNEFFSFFEQTGFPCPDPMM